MTSSGSLMLFLLLLLPLLSTCSSESIGDYLSFHFQPFFQQTFQQLTELVLHFAQQLFDRFPVASARTAIFPTAPWVSDLFGGVNSISTQWNQHLVEFFNNIQTTIEPKGRTLISVPTLEQKLAEALKKLLVKLEDFFVDEVHLLLISLLMKYQMNAMENVLPEFNRLLHNFRSDVARIFDQREKELLARLDQLLEAAADMWNDFKALILG